MSGVDPNASVSQTPTWVKVLGIIAIVVGAAFLVLHFTGAGFGHHHMP